jgi:hypothetical protein
MPNLPDQLIHVKAADGTIFEYKAPCNVAADGEFSIVIDERLDEIARNMLRENRAGEDESFRSWKNDVHLGHSYGKHRVYAKALSNAMAFLRACAKDFIEGEQSTERVILYNAELQVSFWRAGAGIYPNGAGPGISNGQWWTPKTKAGHIASRNDAKPTFSIGIGAAVFDKVTTTRSTGKTIRFELVRDPENRHDQQTDAALKLNSFSGLDLDPESTTNMEMPYTPQAAEFFYSILIALCKMGESLDAFLADKDRLQKAIESTGAKALPWNL